MLEAGDSNEIDSDVGQCVLPQEELRCQTGLDDGEASWFGMFD